MTVAELSTIMLALLGLAILRFGIPILVMWLLNLACCRIFHLSTESQSLT